MAVHGAAPQHQMWGISPGDPNGWKIQKRIHAAIRNSRRDGSTNQASMWVRKREKPLSPEGNW